MRLVLAPALAFLALVAGAAAAQDACLSGATVLEDQRQIATLRAAAESTCPCAAAATANAWKRCTKSALNGALAAGTLRQECKKTMRALLKGSTCGSRRIACGRVSRNGDPSCKLTRPNACTSRKKFDATACTAQTTCADVIDWSAGTCDDVRAPGPYAPGFQYVTIVKDSAASPGTPRVLQTAVWYPAVAGSGPIDPTTGGVPGAPADGSGGPYPVILFSHGSCGYETQSTFLTPLLASRGFVVIAPPHVGNTAREFPQCGLPAAQVASAQERPRDMIAALDKLLVLNGSPGSALLGLVDGEHVGMMGHSFGGLTSYLVANAEPRVDAAVALAPAAGAAFRMPVPSLTMLGAIDSVVSNPNARAAWASSVEPKWLVEVEDAGHYAFSDLCFPSADCNPPTTRAQDEAHALALRYIVPFLEIYVAGNERFRPLLATPVPGVAYTQAAP
ncbi:MAG: dienelactone hydrolase family protein [bacterium]|nr:dienelactone hydrolase family protein [bacterium]